ncbi:MAG: hypothetical protein GY743_24560, partial [Planctomycetaceae bacterium]|nr:hypothetical protein [Planctomycetaceae bacterium]
GLNFLKLYLLHCYETDTPFPKLDKEFVKEVLKVPCKDAKSGRPAGEKAAATKRVLRDLYKRHYKPYVSKEVPYTHLNTVIDYMAVEVVTMYENNIKGSFVKHIERFINVSWGKKDALAEISSSNASSKEKTSKKNTLSAQLRKVKINMLSPGEKLTSDEMYHEWIEAQRPYVMPQCKLNKGVHYD